MKEYYFDLISPYGYGGFWGRISDYETLNKAYTEYCIKHHYICEFVRFNLFSEYYHFFPGDVECRTHNVVCSLERSSDEIWRDFKSNVRRNVRRGEKNGLEFIIDLDGKYILDFLRIYYSTMELNNANEEYFFSEAFFNNILKLGENIALFHAAYRGVIISSEIVLFGKENCYFYLGGSNRDYSEMRPNDFLKNRIINYSKEKGYKNYVLGGGYGSDGSLFQYKAGFAPNGIVDFYIGKRIFNQKVYKELLCIREKDNPKCLDTAFFPQYRF